MSGYPRCAKCHEPMDPVIIREGWRMHPGCEFPCASIGGQVVDSGVGFAGKSANTVRPRTAKRLLP